jgi:hypothetical protein
MSTLASAQEDRLETGDEALGRTPPSAAMSIAMDFHVPICR